MVRRDRHEKSSSAKIARSAGTCDTFVVIVSATAVAVQEDVAVTTATAAARMAAHSIVRP